MNHDFNVLSGVVVHALDFDFALVVGGDNRFDEGAGRCAVRNFADDEGLCVLDFDFRTNFDLSATGTVVIMGNVDCTAGKEVRVQRELFALEIGDACFAEFAIPGVKAGQRNTSEKEFAAALENKCVVTDSDSLEARQIKAMVEGMKNEARRYLAAGGSIVEYGKRLTERQDAEIAIYNRVKADIDKARATLSESEFMTYWEKRNDELRNLGIKTISLSDE